MSQFFARLSSLLFRFVPRLVVGLIVGFATLLPRQGTHRQVMAQVCDLVAAKFYKADDDLERWVKNCREKRRRIGLFWTRGRFMAEVQALLDELAISHLGIYDPSEDRRLWQGKALDTGVRARWIEDHLIVYEVIENSPAARADVRKGDELIAIDGDDRVSVGRSETESGRFLFRRAGEAGHHLEIEIFLDAAELKIDRAPRLTELAPGVGRLEITSFRGEYFLEPVWRPIASGLAGFQRVVVDLRGNSGGNLVAMLRALSPFFCQPSLVGKLSQPRRAEAVGREPKDDLDEMAQLAALERYRVVPLKTYGEYGCFRGPVTVLVDEGTASVAEIFAASMALRPGSEVWGQPSAGDVVLATWYALPLLGPGYSLSIPEALYLTTNDDSLEGSGVWPGRLLKYDLGEARQGLDSWLLRAGAGN